MLVTTPRTTLVSAIALVGFFATGAAAQGMGEAAPPADATTAAARKVEIDDRAIDPAQPDFTVINLPTTLRMPQWKGSFRIAHRFTRSLSEGSFRDLLGDGLGTDFGSVIGLEFRFGLPFHTQVGVFRTSGKTVEFFTEKELMPQGDSLPVTISAFGSLEGSSNFDAPRAGSVGIVASRKFGQRGAIYAQPLYVHNTNPTLLPSGDHDAYGNRIAYRNTTMLGIGARFSVRPGLYLTGEYAPRLNGFGDDALKAFAVEKVLGGHVFQINFSNALGLSLADVARGAASNSNWFLGFNISRKFY